MITNKDEGKNFRSNEEKEAKRNIPAAKRIPIINGTKNTKWKQPKKGGIKANINAILNEVGKWGVGVIFRDEEGETLVVSPIGIEGYDGSLMEKSMDFLKVVEIAED